MTSDKSGPVRTASPALEEDLDDTRVRKEVTAEQASDETPDATQPRSGAGKSAASAPKAEDAEEGAASKGAAPKSSARTEKGSAAAGRNAGTQPEQAVPAPPAKPSAARPPAEAPVPPAPEEAGSGVPTTGGIWRSAYEAGQPGKQPKPAAAGDSEPKAPSGLVSAIGRATAKDEAPTAQSSPAPQSAPASEPDSSAKSWNRVPAPDAPPAPPAGTGDGTDGVRSGAMKAAQAALDAARSAAKKVTSIKPDEEARAATPATEARTRPEMHYTAGGVRGAAAAVGAEASGASGQDAPGQPASTPTPEAARSAPAGPRRVRLAISRVDPWSVMKLAFLLAVAIAIMTVVATAVFWSVLDSLSVFTTVQKFVEDAVGPQSNVNLTQFVEFPRVISLATLISICNVVLLTAIATIMAFLYNITAALVGGVHMTLTDD